MPKKWTRDETLIVLKVYCDLPFGLLHKQNPDIIRVAGVLGRTPSSVAMKAANLASLDGSIQQKGLKGASNLDRQVWAEFFNDSESIAEEIESLYEALFAADIQLEPDYLQPFESSEGKTEVIREVKVRRVQSRFRKAVLASYDYRCALSGIQLPEVIVASHIIPWSENEQRRADPTNGIALSALYDNLFDRGLISFSNDLSVIVSDELKAHFDDSEYAVGLLNIQGRQLNRPARFHPAMEALEYHRAKHNLS